MKPYTIKPSQTLPGVLFSLTHRPHDGTFELIFPGQGRHTTLEVVEASPWLVRPAVLLERPEVDYLTNRYDFVLYHF